MMPKQLMPLMNPYLSIILMLLPFVKNNLVVFPSFLPPEIHEGLFRVGATMSDSSFGGGSYQFQSMILFLVLAVISSR